jgi:hypothetical protein
MQIIMNNSSRNKNFSFKLVKNNYQTVADILWLIILRVDSKELETHLIPNSITIIMKNNYLPAH